MLERSALFVHSRICNKKGSMIVEASLVVPIVILCIISVIYIAFILYQQTCLQALADITAERGAAIYTNPSKDMLMGKVSKNGLNDAGLYWRLFGFDEQSMLLKVRQYLEPSNSNSILDNTRILASTHRGSSVKASTDNKVIYNKLVVSIEDTYKIPLGNLLSLFGLRDSYTVSVKSEAVVNEPAEFIRNTDFILSTERELEKKYPKLKNFAGKTRDVISNLNENLDKLFGNSN
jgi:hypothetical protein